MGVRKEMRMGMWLRIGMEWGWMGVGVKLGLVMLVAMRMERGWG